MSALSTRQLASRTVFWPAGGALVAAVAFGAVRPWLSVSPRLADILAVACGVVGLLLAGIIGAGRPGRAARPDSTRTAVIAPLDHPALTAPSSLEPQASLRSDSNEVALS